MRVEVYDLEGELKATFAEVKEYTVDQSKGLPLMHKITEDESGSILQRLTNICRLEETLKTQAEVCRRRK